MAKGFCEDCKRPQEIVPNGFLPGRSRQNVWEFVVHKDPTAERICDGSGKKIR